MLVRRVTSACFWCGDGILPLSQLARQWPITPDSWRWLFQFAGVPALLGIFVLIALPESPKWLASRGASKASVTPLRELFQPPLIRFTIVGVLISSIPMIGAWSASKWMIPWSDKIAGAANVSYKAATQGWWAFGAVLGSFAGAQLASWIGRRLSYCLISLATVTITFAVFQLTAPLQPAFHPIVFTQGFVATLFFGWLALYLPELFPTAFAPLAAASPTAPAVSPPPSVSWPPDFSSPRSARLSTRWHRLRVDLRTRLHRHLVGAGQESSGSGRLSRCENNLPPFRPASRHLSGQGGDVPLR